MENHEQSFDINLITQNINNAVVNATRSSNVVSTSDFNYLNHFTQISRVMQYEGNNALEMMAKLMQNELPGKKPVNQIGDDDDKFDILTDMNDQMLDKIGNSLDDAAGLKKKDAELVIATLNIQNKTTRVTPISSWNSVARQKKKEKMINFRKFNLLSAHSIVRPQLKFKDKIDNSNTPFVPKIKEKPNSIKPLAILVEVDDNGNETYSHPYEVELEKFQPKQEFLQITTCKAPKPLKDVPLELVSTKKSLLNLLEDLKKCDRFAVDLEHHSYRTFQGITCLMQISTYFRNYLIDCLELRNDLHILNEVFTSPSILKIFHGADSDIQWLQRDFGIYVVNLFDTGQAAKILNFAHLSLSHLMKHYCKIEPDKQFQLADWRIRPLTNEMINYAIEDTHYLLYIYERLNNELVAKGNSNNNLLRNLFDRCKEVCLKKYEKPFYTADSYKTLLRKSKTNFNCKQEYALKELFAWRDRMARNEDESLGYVLPNHMLLKIAEVLPREQQGILACCNPIPPLVKQQLNEIHLIILKARDIVETTNQKEISTIPISNYQSKSLDLDDNLNSRYDTFHLDNEQHLPTLLNNDYCHSSHHNIESKSSILLEMLSINNNKLNTNLGKTKEITSNFISFYERYETAKSELKRLDELKSENEQPQNNEMDIKPSCSDAQDNISRVFEHLINVQSQKQSVQEEEPQQIQGTAQAMADEKRINKKKLTPDIPCNSVASVQWKQEQRNKNFDSNVKPFDYGSYDYSRFSSNKPRQGSNTSFDPDSNFQRNRNKKGKFNPRNQRNQNSDFKVNKYGTNK